MLAHWLSPLVGRCCCVSDGSSWLKGAIIVDGEIAENPPVVPGLGVNDVMLRSPRRVRQTLPRGPKDLMVPTYATADQEVLHGEPLYSGNILQLTLGESIHEMKLAIHVNGFSLVPSEIGGVTPVGQGQGTSRAWSPFSLVEKCQVKSMQHSAYWAVFKLTVFRKEGLDRCYYFATTGSNAYQERDQWVAEMVTAISHVTMSLFPPHAITVQPLPDVETTSTRIMAGYLLQSGQLDNVSLFYCELHAYSGGEARLRVYKDEWCQQEVTSMLLAESSTVSTRKGTYCTVFGIDSHRFCARTREEKDLWLRAVSNVKVKLMFDAPDPTSEDLAVIRAAVHERVEELRGAASEPADPLLASVPRAPPRSPRGDNTYPDPIDESADPPAKAMPEDDTSEGSAFDARSLQQDRALKGLEPEDCRRLLRSVSTKMDDDDGGACGEKPGADVVGKVPRRTPQETLQSPSSTVAKRAPEAGPATSSAPLHQAALTQLPSEATAVLGRPAPEAGPSSQELCSNAGGASCIPVVCMPGVQQPALEDDVGVSAPWQSKDSVMESPSAWAGLPPRNPQRQSRAV
mmetsp:Transcript_43116/g.91903  ORF Transcript_43116/g.91903 Transcript_43116/m.91903 type:complete len:572 (+) Transcript_43116:84-1799(+)